MPENIDAKHKFPGMVCNQPRLHPDSREASIGRKTVNQMMLSGLHYDNKIERFGRHNEKRNVKKARFPSANFSRKSTIATKGVKLKKR